MKYSVVGEIVALAAAAWYLFGGDAEAAQVAMLIVIALKMEQGA